MTNLVLERLSLQLRRHGKDKSILFTGAGFSAGAKNVTSADVPAGKDVIKFMQAKTGEDIEDLGLLSQLFIDQFGEHKLFAYLTTEFRAKETRPSHLEVISFPWRAIYTTNYDDVAEVSATKSGVRSRSYDSTQHPNVIEPNSLPIIHLNGYVNSITFQDFAQRIKLTNVSYLSDDISKSPWGQKFRSDIITSPNLIFVGYSMYDLDIARIIYEFPDMKDRVYFVTHENPSAAARRKLRDFGTLLDIGLDGFADFLAGVRREGIETKEVYFTNIERLHKISSVRSAPTDKEVREFLVLGDLNLDLLASEVAQGTQNYSVTRDCVEKIAELSTTPGPLNVILHSNIGNGKSVCAQQIGQRFAIMGAEVFTIQNNTKKAMEEIAQAHSIPARKVFVVDDLYSNFDAVRAIQSFNHPDTVIIATTRTYLYDLRRSEVERLFGGRLFEFELDRLTRGEAKAAIRLFDVYGYWRDLQCTSEDQKRDFIERKCSAELRTLLLYFLDTQPIKEKLRALFGPKASRDHDIAKLRKVLILSQLINIAGFQSRFEILSDLLEFDTYRLVKSVRGEYSEFMSVRDGKIALRSSILSDYILKHILEGDLLIETMIDVLTRLDVLVDSESIYRELSKIFVRFSFLEPYVQNRNKRDFLIKFYENVKELRKQKTEPLFWLQYAIARLSLHEFREAKLLFDASYSFSKARGYTENRHLDNQYARYLLESRTQSNEFDDYIDAFRKADQILKRQMAAEPLSYNPYRVARNYLDFVRHRRGQLGQGDKLTIIRSSTEILRKINEAPERLRNYPAVRECEKGLREVIALLQDAFST